MRLDAPKNLVPRNTGGLARRESPIQLLRPGVYLAPLWLGQREELWVTPEPLPQPVKKLQLFLGRQGIQIDVLVCHGPFSLALSGACNAGLTLR